MESTKQHPSTAYQTEQFALKLQSNQSFHTQTTYQPPIYSKAIIPTHCVTTYTLKTYTSYLPTAQSALQKL